MVHIFSNNLKLLSHHIVEVLGRDGVILEGISGEPHEKQKVLMIIVENNKIRVVQEIVNEHDNDGYMVVIEASELH